MSATAGPATASPLVFLSYRRADSEASALLLYKELTARFGEGQICMDIYSIPGGGNWFDYIDSTLGSSALVLALIGPSWLTATDEKGCRLDDPEDVLRKELELALERGVRLIPLLVQGAGMPRVDQLPETLRQLADRFPHRIGTGSFDADVGELEAMVARILDELRADQARARAEEDPEAARQAAAQIEDSATREAVLAEIERAQPAPTAPAAAGYTLRQCLDVAGLGYNETAEGEAFLIPFAGQRRPQVVVLARELTDGTAFLSTEFEPYVGFGKKQLLQLLLKATYTVDYVKALALSEGRFALAAELPPGVVTPAVCDGLVRGLVGLADVKGQADLVNARSWQERIAFCRVAQGAAIQIEPDRAREETVALLEASGCRLGPLGFFELDLGMAGMRPISLHVTERVISIVLPVPGRKPGGDKEKLGSLLDFNRNANVAKVGLDPDGDIGLLYEVPQAFPGVVERATEQLGPLFAAVHMI